MYHRLNLLYLVLQHITFLLQTENARVMMTADDDTQEPSQPSIF